MSAARWQPVTRARPCPACQKTDWCAFSPDGSLLKCERVRDVPAGFRLVNPKDGGALFRRADSWRAAARRAPSGNGRHTATAVSADWSAAAARFTAAITPEQRAALAGPLRVTVLALESLGVGWATVDELRAMRASGAGWADSFPHDGAFTFPERDGGGRIVGLSLRAVDGRKGFPRCAQRGLIVPASLRDRPDPVLVVEGASDVAACEVLGLAAVGRPSNSGGAEHLARVLKSRAVLVVGENDAKTDGAWPGRDGAERVAARLASEWEKAVAWALPPNNTKDVRAWLAARIANGLDLSDAAACKAAGAELVQALTSAAEETRAEKRPPQSELLVRLALERYRIGLGDGDEPFAVPRDGPNVALMFRGSRDALRSALSREYRRQYRTTPNASALADALTALAGEAHECQPEPVHLRIARHDVGIVLDLGGADGRCILIRPGGWDVLDVSPVLFRRTALTAVLVEPVRGGDVEALRELVNVTDATWPLVLGWLVAALIPDIPHPALMEGGGQGTGKTCAARMLVGLVDPSPAPLRSQPTEERQWAVTASGSWAVAIDNVSSIPAWWSDALCKAVTGDGWVGRKLYTDSELSVLSFRRCIILTSIDAGALRGDLGDRLVLADLLPIDPESRRTEAELDALYAERRPAILGALLDLVAEVLSRLDSVECPALPRMADFARVLAAMDSAAGTDALRLYMAQAGRIAQDVIDADVVALAVVTFIHGHGEEWSGTASELLSKIGPAKPQKGWPESGRGLSGRLRRLRPALLCAGVDVEPPDPADKLRMWRIRRVCDSTAQTAQPPKFSLGAAENADGDAAVDVTEQPNRPVDRPTENGPADTGVAGVGRSGGSGGCFGVTSGDVPVPDGWTRAGWASYLRKRAGDCEALHPDKAADYLQQADVVLAGLADQAAREGAPS